MIWFQSKTIFIEAEWDGKGELEGSSIKFKMEMTAIERARHRQMKAKWMKETEELELIE